MAFKLGPNMVEAECGVSTIRRELIGTARKWRLAPDKNKLVKKEKKLYQGGPWGENIALDTQVR